jgi:hypothetical protein
MAVAVASPTVGWIRVSGLRFALVALERPAQQEGVVAQVEAGRAAHKYRVVVSDTSSHPLAVGR